MKPKDLKCPFSWQFRHVTIEDRIWYVPNYYHQYETFHFPGWNHPTLFCQEQPLYIEYCSGNGSWIVSHAFKDRKSNWIAVEKKFERVRKIWSKMKNYELDNLLIVCGEGYKATCLYFPSQSVQGVFINFPDPWPKNKHAKHRLIQPSFIKEIERILVAGGHLTFVTDDEPYSQWMLEVMGLFSNFKNSYEEPYFVTELADYGSSYFEDLWKQKGRVIRYHHFYKRLSEEQR